MSELLPLKTKQFIQLKSQNWIAIDRIKRGPSNHKAFLAPEGQQILKQRSQDIELLLMYKNKSDDIFTYQNTHNKTIMDVTSQRITNGRSVE